MTQADHRDLSLFSVLLTQTNVIKALIRFRDVYKSSRVNRRGILLSKAQIHPNFRVNSGAC